MPQILYKHRCFDNRTIHMLENNEVYFANPRNFNDPFDCLAQDLYNNFRESVARFLFSKKFKVPPESIRAEEIKPFLDWINTQPALIG